MSKEISEKIKVYIRQRPYLDIPSDISKQKGNSNETEHQSGIKSVSKDSKSCNYFSASNNVNQTFNMDKFFISNSNQDELFNTVAAPIIDSALQGYNGTILAYGQTSSGKTYTMLGGSPNKTSERGLIPRCVERLLSGSNSTSEIWASYLQIYCEQITDLLYQNSDQTVQYSSAAPPVHSNTSGKITPYQSNGIAVNGSNNSLNNTLANGIVPSAPLQRPNTPLQLAIREKADSKGVYVEGLSRYRITSVDDLWELLKRGDENRCTASTNMNETSSRSHAALLLNIIIPDEEQDENEATGKGTYRQSSLILVDLAGSERATATEGRSMARQEEAKAINLSLSALGNCMSALAEGRAHVPYRDAKLTRLLQGCLGGGARTAVIVNLCPGEDVHGETLSALRFASRASKVKVVAKISKYQDYEAMYREAKNRIKLLEDNNGAATSAAKLKEQIKIIKDKDSIIEQQADEISNLKQQLELLQKHYSASPSTSKGTSTTCNNSTTVDATASNNNTMDNEMWSSKLTALTQEHLKELAKTQSDYNYKLMKAKQSQESTTTELISLQHELNEEKQKRLSIIQEFRELNEKKYSDESVYKGRVEELLSELSELRDKYEDSIELNKSSKKHISELQDKISTMVTKEQVKEMESLFIDTVKRLSDRVNALEGGRRSAGSDPGSNVNNGSNRGNPTGSGGSSRNIRFEPGKIRSGNSNYMSNDSYSGKR